MALFHSHLHVIPDNTLKTSLSELNDTWILMGQFRGNVSSAVFRNQMEDRLLTNKLGSIELEEKRLLRRFRSETRLMRIKQEQRLGSGLTCARTHINKAGTPSTQSAVCRHCVDHVYI